MAESLGAAPSAGAGEAVTDGLLKWSVSEDPYTAVTLMKVLQKLNLAIPPLPLADLKRVAPHLARLL